MEKTAVQRLARILRGMVAAVFTLNLLCLPLVPGAVAFWHDHESVWEWVSHESGDGLFWVAVIFVGALYGIFLEPSLLTAWSLFFWLCGGCTAMILWQAKKVLDTILEGNPFQIKNARALSRAAVCCWMLSSIALARLFWWLGHDHSAAPLFTYNTLFILGFLMAGLLFLVMSALFRQAAELKEDQDLTI